MTLPNPVVPGATLNITRRTIGGQFFLLPDRVVNRTVQFSLAACAEKHSIELHATSWQSNHHHTIATDPDGAHPDFRRDLHSFLARALNRHHGLEGSKWAPDQNPPTLLVGRDDVMHSIAYTIANPCRHHLVESPEEWPGFATHLEYLAGRPRVLRKPEGFYDPAGELPDEATLIFVKPRACSNMSDAAYRSEILERVRELCARARMERKKRGTIVLGRRAITKQNPTDTPRNQPARGTRKPLVKCLDVAVRKIVLKWIKEFRRAYKIARHDFERGEKDVTFPFATYLLERRYGVNCETTGPPVTLTA